MLTSYAKKDNGIILKNKIVGKLHYLFKSMLEYMTLDNNLLSITYFYIIGDRNFLVILLGKEY